jgi:hypothetical protein
MTKRKVPDFQSPEILNQKCTDGEFSNAAARDALTRPGHLR